MCFLTVFFVTLCLAPINGDSFWQGVLEEEVCETKECYNAAEHIKKWMNPAFNPCEDFFEYNCGYWHSPDNSTVNKAYNRSIGSRGTIINFHLKNILQDKEIVKESRLFEMLSQFLSLCLDEETIEARGVSPALEALRKAGGWPVLEQDWSEENWNIENTKIAFGGYALFEVKLGYGINYTLEIEAMTPDSRIASVEDLSEGFQNQSVNEYYMKGCEFAEAFGADKSKAEADMREAVEFEIAIAELTKRLDEVSNSSSYDEEKITLSELQEYVNWINWTYLLTNILPESESITKDYIIRTRYLERLKELGNLIDNYPKRTVANFVMWKTALTLTEYLPAKVRNSSGNEEYPYKDRYERCSAFVAESSLLGAAVSYIAKKTVDDTKAAEEMTENIVNELLLHISELEWLDEKTRSTAIQALRETKIRVAFPEEATDLKVVEEIYREVHINTSNFFDAVMDSKRWVRKTKFEKLGRPPQVDVSLKDHMETAISTSAYFDTQEHVIVVSAGFMHFVPLFSSKVPAYVNYGHLGGVIAHELTHALDFQTALRGHWMSGLDNSWRSGMNNYKAKYVMERWGSNETEEIYEDKKQCIIDQYGSFKDTYTGQKLNSNYTDVEDVADNGGFKLALRAYRRLVANLVTPEPRLPTLQQYSPEQLFIISLANTYCEIPDKEQLIEQIQWDSHSPFEFRVKGIMMNSPDFSELFHCQKGDPMNPVEKCDVW